MILKRELNKIEILERNTYLCPIIMRKREVSWNKGRRTPRLIFQREKFQTILLVRRSRLGNCDGNGEFFGKTGY
jgi:hypothetical protein